MLEATTRQAWAQHPLRSVGWRTDGQVLRAGTDAVVTPMDPEKAQKRLSVTTRLDTQKHIIVLAFKRQGSSAFGIFRSGARGRAVPHAARVAHGKAAG